MYYPLLLVMPGGLPAEYAVCPTLPAIPPPKVPFSFPASFGLCFPKLMGTYLCLYMCNICRFIVMKNNIKKYNSSIGQNTGTSNILKNVMINAIDVPR